MTMPCVSHARLATCFLVSLIVLGGAARLEVEEMDGSEGIPSILFGVGMVSYLIAVPADAANFCWAPHIERGVGRVGSSCGDGNELDAGLCYPKCKPDQSGVGPVCWSSRGAATGRGVGKVPGCQPDEEANAGLCYDKCPSTHEGIGPYCVWRCPDELPVRCIGSCAKSSKQCASNHLEQIVRAMAVGDPVTMALTISKTIWRKLGSRDKLKDLWTKIKNVNPKNRKAVEAEAKSVNEDLQQKMAEALFEAAKEQFRDGKSIKEVQKLLLESAPETKAMSHEALYTLLVKAHDHAKDEVGKKKFQWRDIDIIGVADVVRSFWRPLCSDI